MPFSPRLLGLFHALFLIDFGDEEVLLGDQEIVQLAVLQCLLLLFLRLAEVSLKACGIRLLNYS